MLDQVTQIEPFGKLPQVYTIDRFAQDNNFLEALMAPIMMSAALGNAIKKMPIEAFGNTHGLQIFYNLFSMLNMVDEYRKQNLRWDKQDEIGLKSTKIMLEKLRTDLIQRLEINIPLHSIFK